MMNDKFYDYGAESEPELESGEVAFNGGSWVDGLRNVWQWDELAAEIGQESRARVAFVGRAGAGKSLLFNRLRGWVISGEDETAVYETGAAETGMRTESLGLFVLADLPSQPADLHLDGGELLMLGDPALVVYLLDGTAGVSAADFRWVAAFRAAGKPLLGAWFLGAGMNAVMTWYAVALAIMPRNVGASLVTKDDMLLFAPIFVAILVWLTRILLIGSGSVAADRFLHQNGRSSSRPRRPPLRDRPRYRPVPVNGDDSFEEDFVG